MFAYKSELNLATNASCVDRNLTLLLPNDTDTLIDQFAVIDKNLVNVVSVTSEAAAKTIPIKKDTDKDTIKQIKWVEIEEQIFFVIASTHGLQIYDSNVENQIYYHCMRETGDERSYSNGICALRKVLCVGTHLGTVWIFAMTSDFKDFKLLNRVYAHDEAVLMLEGLGNHMVSSSNMIVYLWTYNRRAFDIIRKIDVNGITSAPSVIKFKFGLIIIAYASGEFCLFDVNDEEFCLRTIGHKLKITDMDFGANFTLITVSSDCYLKVWKYLQIKNEMNLLQSIFNDEGPLYGVGFLNYGSTEFCTITGDSKKVKIYMDLAEKIHINVEKTK